MNTAVQRVVTALVGAPLVIAAVWFGGWPLAALVVVASLIAQWELYSLAGVDRHVVMMLAGLASGAFIILRNHVSPDIAELAIVAGIIVILVSALSLHNSGDALAKCAVALAGLVYPTLLFGYILLLRGDATDAVGRELAILTVAGVWGADTAAYYGGRLFGRHPMTPISPKKTWEGFVAGAFGAVVIVGALSALLGPHGPLVTLFVGLAAGLTGPVGDLIESALKRSAHVKDSGSLLPGHGGILDRVDALIFVSPLVYMWARLAGLI